MLADSETLKVSNLEMLQQERVLGKMSIEEKGGEEPPKK